ncbi:putative phage tail protein [Clostridium sp. JN-9]|uniref:putative phage tail protein n=1 Tax=Clostridium sp. JN-9 TaxID=2507159 RepID=UPI000FFDFF5D|nr:putative phage tail protein [Clostridium sp. JN-9]QAT40825.1 DUF2313 domain-containing protein [Clostridium sp. JN-9]
MHSDKLKNYVPPFISNTRTYTEIYSSQGNEFDTLDECMADLMLQFNIDTATWALDIYEKSLGIVTNHTKELDYRRSVIKSKDRGTGKFNSVMLKLVCDSFTNGNVEVTYNGIITVKFNAIRGIPPNLNDLKDVVEQIKPAYKILQYIFIYLTWDEFNNYNKSFDDWDTLNLSWDKFETYKE